MAIKRNTELVIQAPVEKVFDAIAHVGNFKEAAPHIKKVEVISDIDRGVGLRFKETREMNGRESTTELECTEYAENERVRFVADQGGTIWDTVMTVKSLGAPAAQATELAMEMEARPHQLMARIITPLIMGMVGKAVEHDMEAIKSWCEES